MPRESGGSRNAAGERDATQIINISSGTAFAGPPTRIHYVTSKAGILGFTRCLAREEGPNGIR
ncbi:MAG: SDR family NAD(P)-dependent oxidoreductase, partial [Candidatus Rokubacteria bacterium]|nr:SDR family NAD(P)-dependent oxidoreductase [Candidatus Rokubacteria bacterium]